MLFAEAYKAGEPIPPPYAGVHRVGEPIPPPCASLHTGRGSNPSTLCLIPSLLPRVGEEGSRLIPLRRRGRPLSYSPPMARTTLQPSCIGNQARVGRSERQPTCYSSSAAAAPAVRKQLLDTCYNHNSTIVAAIAVVVGRLLV